MSFFYPMPSPYGHKYYETAQVAAFAAFVLLLLGQGYRRGYPQRAWVPLVAAATLGLVLGCQLVFLPLPQWLAWLRGDAAAVQALAGGPRSIIGGAWGSFLVVLVLGRVLGLRVRAALDALAAPLCWALAIQSVGCVLAGCCWGEATASQWGVAYGPGTAAYAAQVAQGLPAGAAYTHPLVPTQLLQLLLCAGAGLALHHARRCAWPAGSRYLLGIGLLCLGRLAIEFWRDPASEPLLATPVALGSVALAGVQWLMLTKTLALLSGWAWLVRQSRAPAAPTALPAPRPATTALVTLGLLLATTRLAPVTLSWAETATLQLLLLLVLLAEGHTWLTLLGREVPRLARLPLAGLAGALLLVVTAQAPAPRRDSVATRTLLLSGGVVDNYHDGELEALHGGSCNGGAGSGYSNYYSLHQRARAGGAELTSLKTGPTGRQRELGGGLWVGELRTVQHPLGYAAGPSVVHPDTVLRSTLVDAHFFIGQQLGHDWLTVRYRLGLHMGLLGQYTYFEESGSSRGSDSDTNFAPEVMLRLGHPRLLFAQYDSGYGAENALGSYVSRVALGSGLGRANGRQLLVGYASAPHYPAPGMAFASANVRLPIASGLSSLSLEPYIATDFSRHNSFSLKLHYQLGTK